MTTPPTTGTIAITTTTTGPEPDGDGYTIKIDGGAELAIGAAATLRREDLGAGNHSVELGGLAANCVVAGVNPRTVSVAAGGTATVAFSVTCDPTTGSLRITSSTTGPSPDPDGYTITLDGSERGPLIEGVEVTLTGLIPGDHQVGLSGIAANCQAQDNPRPVSIAAGATATVAFAVTCSAPSLRWEVIPVGTDFNLYSVWASSARDLFAGGIAQDFSTKAILHYDGNALSTKAIEQNVGIGDIWGSTGSDVFAVGSQKITFGRYAAMALHYDGNTWSTMNGPDFPEYEGYLQAGFSAVWGASGTDVFAVGSIADDNNPYGRALIAHYDGAAWSLMPIGNPDDLTLTHVSGSSSSDVYAVGYYEVLPFGIAEQDRAVILHYNGHEWSEVLRQGNLVLRSLWVSSANDVYATGYTTVLVGEDQDASQRAEIDEGAIWHFDGKTWSAMANPTSEFPGKMWGSSASDIYMLARNGETSPTTIWRFDGTSWKAVYTHGHALTDIWGASPTDVFAVGDDGSVLHGTR